MLICQRKEPLKMRLPYKRLATQLETETATERRRLYWEICSKTECIVGYSKRRFPL